MRLLIYSQDGNGLGHLRRTGNIAQRVLARVPDAAVMGVADARAIPAFVAKERMDYLKLPTLVKTGRDSSAESSWTPAALPLATRDAVRLRSALLVQALEAYGPDVVLVDHMPVGALGELRPLLDHARKMASPPQMFLGLRDVLDAPEVIQQAWRRLGGYEYLSAYDAVLVYGSRDVYDADAAYDLSAHARRVEFCNYVTPPNLPVSLQPDSSDEAPLLLVMGGGGGDAYPMAKTVLNALPKIRAHMKVRCVVLTGPNMAPDQHASLTRACLQSGSIVSVESSRDDVLELLGRASAVVTMAGYNSLCEVLAARKKALVVPRAGPSQEQRIRCDLFSKRNLIRVLDPNDLEPVRMAQELEALLRDEDSTPDWSSIALDGAERAADWLLTPPVDRPSRIAGRAIGAR